MLLQKDVLQYLLFSPNISGGGGNIEELRLFLEKVGKLNLARKVSGPVVLLSRLGKQNARANAYPEKTLEGLRLVKRAVEKRSKVKIRAVLPPEGLGGQLARTAWAGMLEGLEVIDGDIAGGLGIPALSLAHPAFDELMEEKRVYVVARLKPNGREFKVEEYEAESSEEMEQTMREIVAEDPMEAVWFSSPPIETERTLTFTPGIVTNAIVRGFMLKALRKEALAVHGAKYLGRSVVRQVRFEKWVKKEGFTQAIVELENGAKLFVLNEFVKVKWGKEHFRSPTIICALRAGCPIQSQQVREGDVLEILLLPALGSKDKRLVEKHKRFWTGLGVEGDVLTFYSL